jgi:hypothetical protein
LILQARRRAPLISGGGTRKPCVIENLSWTALNGMARMHKAQCWN